jgi:predicted acylesterase/phospholipase RssA
MSYGIVFSGGGALGAWEVGCYDAIRGRHSGNLPIIVTGASAGALNAVGVCAGMQPPQLEKLWAGIKSSDVYLTQVGKFSALPVLLRAAQVGLVQSVTEFFSRRTSLFDTTPFKKTLATILKDYELSFTQSDIYCSISVTNLTLNRREYFYKLPRDEPLPDEFLRHSQGTWRRLAGLELLVDALIGSTALPVLFPPREGMFDGGVLLNQPISPAVALSEMLQTPLEVLYVLIPSPATLGRTGNLLQIAQTVMSTWTSASLLAQLATQKARNELLDKASRSTLPICVIRPPQDLGELNVTLLSFGVNVDKLVEAGRKSANEKLNRFKPTLVNTWYDI